MGEETIHALAGVDLGIPDGESLAVVGLSGSGKSTLLPIIGGLDSPTSERVVVDGHDLNRSSDKELADYRNHSIGFVFRLLIFIQPTIH
jgi:putative ABC transport system ATP-binding protein